MYQRPTCFCCWRTACDCVTSDAVSVLLKLEGVFRHMTCIACPVKYFLTFFFGPYSMKYLVATDKYFLQCLLRQTQVEYFQPSIKNIYNIAQFMYRFLDVHADNINCESKKRLLQQNLTKKVEVCKICEYQKSIPKWLFQARAGKRI